MTSQRLDLILRASVTVLLVAVVGLAGVFGYTAYQDRQEAIRSTPALRVVDQAKKLVRAQPNNATYRVRLGEGLAAAGKYQDAIKQLNAALKIDPKHVGAYYDLGMVAMLNERRPEAARYYEKVIELTEAPSVRYVDSRRENALYNLGNMALDDKEYEKAVGYFKEALRIRKDASDTYLLISRAFVGLGDADEALKYAEYAIAFDPSFAQAQYHAGDLYLKQKNFLKASEHIRRAIEAAPESREPQLLLAKLGTAESWAEKARQQLDSDPLQALDNVKIARRIDTTSAKLALLHGQVLEKLNKKKEALTTYKEGAELDPSDAQIKAAIARMESDKDSK